MRFLVEDNKKFEWTMAVAGILCAIYMGRFCIIRVQASSVDCNLRSVDFPTGTIRTVYRPLIMLDKQLNNNVVYRAEIDEVRVAATYFCGE